ncbi:MAG TPA: hypothetical protein VJ438_01690 [Candidatus Nanoarchaeia archaeon]|nr:hypothetical protein [Candidatus Nanoarchaeia archaeon]
MEDEKIDPTIAETIAQLATNYKLSQKPSEKAKIEKQAREFIKDISVDEADKEKWTAMYNEMKS